MFRIIFVEQKGADWDTQNNWRQDNDPGQTKFGTETGNEPVAFVENPFAGHVLAPAQKFPVFYPDSVGRVFSEECFDVVKPADGQAAEMIKKEKAGNTAKGYSN